MIYALILSIMAILYGFFFAEDVTDFFWSTLGVGILAGALMTHFL